MSRNGKVVVAMSGGVDSSVAACLLKEQGYECVGVFMRVGAEGPRGQGAEGLGEQGIEGTDPAAGAVSTFSRSHVPTDAAATPRRLKHGCCSVADALDARAVAARLGLAFYVLNFENDFERIIEYFVDEYAHARTPNPCVMCNTQLKFGKLLRYADMLEAEFVATGHYARIVRDEDGGIEGSRDQGIERTPPCRLARARNVAKDQSYVLFGIERANLRRCLFPIGEIADKAEVRRIAADLGLNVHDKPDSQEICFVPDNDYKQLVRARRPATEQPGEVRDAAGHVLGTHAGIVNYTIGQRHGLRIAAGKPIYVTNLDAASNTVTVGERDELLSAGLVAERANWLVDPPAVGARRAAEIKIRYHHTAAAGEIRTMPDGSVGVRFGEPQAAVTPGQAAVFYEGETVLGGGWIRAALRRDA